VKTAMHPGPQAHGERLEAPDWEYGLEVWIQRNRRRFRASLLTVNKGNNEQIAHETGFALLPRQRHKFSPQQRNEKGADNRSTGDERSFVRPAQGNENTDVEGSKRDACRVTITRAHPRLTRTHDGTADINGPYPERDPETEVQDKDDDDCS